MRQEPKPQQKPSKELDYEALGVDPPSSDPHGTEDEIAAQLSIKTKHEWHQEGAKLVCTGCPWEHATEPRFIDYILTGTDVDGMPIMKKISSML